MTSDPIGHLCCALLRFTQTQSLIIAFKNRFSGAISLSLSAAAALATSHVTYAWVWVNWMESNAEKLINASSSACRRRHGVLQSILRYTHMNKCMKWSSIVQKPKRKTKKKTKFKTKQHRIPFASSHVHTYGYGHVCVRCTCVPATFFLT